MKKPDGFDLLALLINLFADQEGVTISFEITDGGEGIEEGNAKAS